MHEIPMQLNVDEIEYDTNNPRIKKGIRKIWREINR